jgi:hypothetical protein
MRFHFSIIIALAASLLAGPMDSRCSENISGVGMKEEDSRLKVLLIDGQMNKHHNMALMSEAVTRYLEETGLFEVTHVSTPPPGSGMHGFAPDFQSFDLVVLNYDGEQWPDPVKVGFEHFMSEGGGLVSVHSTDNAFPDWQAFLDMTGVGGWSGRDETWGPAVYWGENGMEYDHGPGKAFHPRQHEFRITHRDNGHAITRKLPERWLHAKDELYSGMRGPAQNLGFLASGFADPEFAGNPHRHEPVLLAISYGKGRVFHTTLGHIGKNEQYLPPSVRCAGFITTLQRGAEWAASGTVTQVVPDDFPAPDKISVRQNEMETE